MNSIIIRLMAGGKIFVITPPPLPPAYRPICPLRDYDSVEIWDLTHARATNREDLILKTRLHYGEISYLEDLNRRLEGCTGPEHKAKLNC